MDTEDKRINEENNWPSVCRKGFLAGECVCRWNTRSTVYINRLHAYKTRLQESPFIE